MSLMFGSSCPKQDTIKLSCRAVTLLLSCSKWNPVLLIQGHTQACKLDCTQDIVKHQRPKISHQGSGKLSDVCTALVS